MPLRFKSKAWFEKADLDLRIKSRKTNINTQFASNLNRKMDAILDWTEEDVDTALQNLSCKAINQIFSGIRRRFDDRFARVRTSRMFRDLPQGLCYYLNKQS